MPEEYTYLFNAIDRLEELKRSLIAAQQQAEQNYMERTE